MWGWVQIHWLVVTAMRRGGEWTLVVHACSDGEGEGTLRVIGKHFDVFMGIGFIRFGNSFLSTHLNKYYNRYYPVHINMT